MSAIIEEVKPWQYGIVGAGVLGFVIGIGVTFWVKHTLVTQGIYNSLF
mgnify:CR=1 FL=1